MSYVDRIILGFMCATCRKGLRRVMFKIIIKRFGRNVFIWEHYASIGNNGIDTRCTDWQTHDDKHVLWCLAPNPSQANGETRTLGVHSAWDYTSSPPRDTACAVRYMPRGLRSDCSTPWGHITSFRYTDSLNANLTLDFSPLFTFCSDNLNTWSFSSITR